MERGKMKKLSLLSMWICGMIFALPMDAVIEKNNPPGQGWTQIGSMECNLSAASRSFESCLNRQNWRTVAVYTMKNGRKLYNFSKQDKHITLMLWEKNIGKCGFSWGEVVKGKRK